MKVVWLIQNLVPYHHARFEGFAAAFSGDAHLIQVTNQDDFNVLEFEASAHTYTLHTLFEGVQRSSLSSQDVRVKLDECLGGIGPDCVCVSGWGMEIGQLMQLWAVRNRIPMVMFSESTSYDMSRSAWKEWIKKQLVQASSAALVGGQPHQDYICELGMEPRAVFLGHNVVDSSHFSKPAGVRPERLPALLETDPFLIVCTRFGQKKNIPALVRAYAKYDQQCCEAGLQGYRLVIAGDGELRAEIEQEIERQNLADRVDMLGAVDYASLPWLYQNAKAFVHASTTEQWGLVVNEAMAAGAPVLLSERCGCAPDLVVEGGNGLQFDPYSEEDMAKTLFEFHQLSEPEQACMGQRGFEIVQDWGPGKFSGSLIRAVDCAVKAGPRGRQMLASVLLRFLLMRGSE